MLLSSSSSSGCLRELLPVPLFDYEMLMYLPVKMFSEKALKQKKNIYIGINPRRELCEGYYAVQNIFFICKTPLSCSHFSYLFFSLLRCIAGASNSERSHLKRSINKDICVSLYNQYCSLIQCSSAV